MKKGDQEPAPTKNREVQFLFESGQNHQYQKKYQLQKPKVDETEGSCLWNVRSALCGKASGQQPSRTEKNTRHEIKQGTFVHPMFLFTPFSDRQPEKWFEIVFVALRQGLIASALSHADGRNSEHPAMLPVGMLTAFGEDGAVALRIKYCSVTIAQIISSEVFISA